MGELEDDELVKTYESQTELVATLQEQADAISAELDEAIGSATALYSEILRRKMEV